MDLDLGGKTALVSGSSRGIGRAIAIALGREGCRVALSSRGGADLDEAVTATRAATGRSDAAVGVIGDLTTEDGVADVVAGALGELGGVDIVVNNLGGSGARSFADCDEQDLRQIMERNLWPAFRLSRSLLPQMRARGGGSIVMIGSIWGREAGGGPSYNVAKAAEMHLAKAMAGDLARDNIRVNSVAPGSILFPGGGWEKRQQQNPEVIAAFVERELPFGRFGTPEEVASVVTFLCSPRAAWVHGACVVVDGGQSRSL